MDSQTTKAVLDDLQGQCRAVCEIAEVAKRNQKSLNGRNPYGTRFHNAVVALSRAEGKLGPVLTTAALSNDEAQRLSAFLTTLKSPTTGLREREDVLKAVKMVCQATILPAIEHLTANPVPETEQVFPLEIVRATRRKYLERVVLQANGCYEHQWFDACSVMVRRLVETAIIELYEAKGRESEIKNGSGEFLMLSGLVDVLLADQSWGLGREAKKALPDIKSLGDRSAHARRYLATKLDVDKVIPGLRVVVEELLHLAGMA